MADETTKKVTSKRLDNGTWDIVTNAPKVSRSITLNTNLHDNSLADMTAWTSEDCVKDTAVDSWIISYQGRVRKHLEAGKTEKEIADLMADFKPDVIQRGPVDYVAAAMNKFSKMSADEQAAFMKNLKARMAGK